ncbi:MAG: DUF3450 family protein [Planctomycetes bacterium]|nr:DUF3450 family protein [Planctomycetota bacterium]
MPVRSSSFLPLRIRRGPAAAVLAALTLAAVLLAAGSAASAQPRPVPPSDPPSLAARQAELRNLLQEVRREGIATGEAREAWQREQAELEDEVRALREETARLEAALPELRTRAAALEREADDAGGRAAAARERHERFRAALRARLAELAVLAEQGLPLDRELRARKARDAAEAASRPEAPLSGAAGELLGLTFRILTDSRTFQATSAVIQGAADEQHVVEVLRVGSVQALARTADGTAAHTLRTDAAGRTAWSPPLADPALAERIRRGLEIVKRRRAPELLLLPVPGPVDRGAAAGGESERRGTQP